METMPASAPKVNGKAYLGDLRKLVTRTEDDLRVRAQELGDVHADLTAKYNEAVRSERTLETFETWRDQYLTQVAVGWVLSCVFLRYLEDNALIEEIWLAGEGERLQRAHDRHQLFFRTGPTLTDRDYLLEAFSNVAKLPGCGDLFGSERNPLWLLGPSGDMAKEILLFFQTVDPSSGKLLRTFGDPHSSKKAETRFLGDLYQDLSEAARKRYALLQTPDFVEEFILDRTLEPAIELFGIDEVRMLDPTCGSGHFLLGSFERLVGRRQREKPAENERDRVQKALDGVYGVDLNPFAVAIARFRMLVAALDASGITKLKNAPNFKIHVAAGDSLLHGRRFGRGGQGLLSVDKEWLPDVFCQGDFEEATAILSQQYHAVVGNPPYIIDRDRAHNAEVRQRYSTCHQKFSLAVPFKELFFDKTVSDSRAGYLGMITANSFMKREFGKKLIEEFLPDFDLTHVIDTSGAYIPGHGTPTVILLARNQSPRTNLVRAVLGTRGEPHTPDIPSRGKVWQSIVQMLDKEGAENEFISVRSLERGVFKQHPWSLGGGGASDLLDVIESLGQQRLDDRAKSIGFASFTGQDDVFIGPESAFRRNGIEAECIKDFVCGTAVRDWAYSKEDSALAPYDPSLKLLNYGNGGGWNRYLWNFRTNLGGVQTFGGKTTSETGQAWWSWYRWVPEKLSVPLSITFAFVATHNHFVLDRGGKVYSRTAPVIKLPPGATVDDHLALLGLLNSSVACFWMQQVCHNKGGPGGGSSKDEKWHDFYEHDGTKLGRAPIPKNVDRLCPLAEELDRIGTELSQNLSDLPSCEHIDAEFLREFSDNRERSIRRSIALQEELDWNAYRLFGLLPEDLTIPENRLDEIPEISPGQRPFEISMARQVQNGTLITRWFERPERLLTTEPPRSWPVFYRELTTKRIAMLESDRSLGLVESMNCKRRWEMDAFQKIQESALREWLRTRIENTISPSTTLTTTTQITDLLRKDADFVQVAELYTGRDDVDLHKLVSELVMAQDVPYLPAFRYKDTGLRKREQWERTWELQRREDAGEDVGKIPVPPKYASTDFQKSHYWTLRGKLDVPKERFISYPLAERDSDPSPVIGWAGWDHAQQAQALAAYTIERKEKDGWTVERLTPLLAGLLELIPWLKQWHNEIDPDMGVALGEFYEGFLESEARALGLTQQALRDWRPPAKTARGGRRKGG
jgi:hypothetical protein